MRTVHLGSGVSYEDGLKHQDATVDALLDGSGEETLFLLEHAPVYTIGRLRDQSSLRDTTMLPAPVVETNRGGQATYHGPGQLVGYPVLWVPGKRGGGMADTVAYVRSVEQLVIDALGDLGLPDVGRLPDYPGVWVEPTSDQPRKIAAIGVR